MASSASGKNGAQVSATALCRGAATIVNAIAAGRGAAFGIGLSTKVTVTLDEKPGVSAPGVEDPKLVELCVKNVFKLFPYKYGASIKVESDIPIARGLKSSSVVANAAVLAAFGALAKRHGEIRKVKIDKTRSGQQLVVGGNEIRDETILDISVRSAKEAGVTITGAFDDASAAYFGGFVVTDNKSNRIMRRGQTEDLDVVVWVPDKRSYTKDVDADAAKAFGREADAVWRLALEGDLYTAMTLNGLIYSAAFGYEAGQKAAAEAMKAGAIAAGLSGTGPAVVAIGKGASERITGAWGRLGGTVIKTKTSSLKASVIC